MSLAILKYDLSNSDDRFEFERAVKSNDMASLLWQLMLNDKKKFYRQLEADNESTEREYDLIDKVWEHIFETAKEHGIEIENLYQ